MNQIHKSRKVTILMKVILERLCSSKIWSMTGFIVLDWFKAQAGLDWFYSIDWFKAQAGLD